MSAPQTPWAAAPAVGPFPPQPAVGNGSPSQAFFQAIAAIPPVQSLPRKRRYPRGQVFTMIVTAIITVLAASGGILVLLLAH